MKIRERLFQTAVAPFGMRYNMGCVIIAGLGHMGLVADPRLTPLKTVSGLQIVGGMDQLGRRRHIRIFAPAGRVLRSMVLPGHRPAAAPPPPVRRGLLRACPRSRTRPQDTRTASAACWSDSPSANCIPRMSASRAGSSEGCPLWEKRAKLCTGVDRFYHLFDGPAPLSTAWNPGGSFCHG